MDLGFGVKNPHVSALAKQALAQTAAAQETAVQQQLDQYDDLLNDKEALEKLRAKRLQQLQSAARQRQNWRAAGHGSYDELTNATSQDTRDTATAFFDATKASERLVVHFYRPSTSYCDIFHKHLQKLAAKHLETRFLKLNVQDCDKTEKGASFLVQRLGIVVMPTLVLIHKRKVVHQVVGFDELGATTTDFTTAALARLLQQYNVLYENEDNDDDDDECYGDGGCGEVGHNDRDDDDDDDDRNGWKGVNAIRVNRKSRYSHQSRYHEEEDEEDF